MGFAISLACCEPGDCHYLPKTTSYLEPSESTFLAGPPCPGCFCRPKAPGHPRGPRDLPGTERGWMMWGAAPGELGDLSWLWGALAGGVERWKGQGGSWEDALNVECESGTPLRGRARFQSILCPKMLLSYNFFWPFALPEGSQCANASFLTEWFFKPL